MYRWQFISKVLMMTVVTIGIVDTFERLRILVMVTAGCFAFFVVKGLPLMIMTGGGFRLYGPPRSMVEDNNDLGLALNMTLPLLFFLSQTETARRLKQLFFGLFIITIPASSSPTPRRHDRPGGRHDADAGEVQTASAAAPGGSDGHGDRARVRSSGLERTNGLHPEGSGARQLCVFASELMEIRP
jgi:hypothetical protein